MARESRSEMAASWYAVLALAVTALGATIGRELCFHNYYNDLKVFDIQSHNYNFLHNILLYI